MRTITIYTDGGCQPNPGAGGWGVAAYVDGKLVNSDYGGEADTTILRYKPFNAI